MRLFKKYLLYLIRWQLSTPILAVVLYFLTDMNTLLATVLANFIGGLIFFWVDKFIFKKVVNKPLWEIVDNYECFDCHKKGRSYRIVEWGKYDKSNDAKPEFRCEECSIKKMKKIKKELNK